MNEANFQPELRVSVDEQTGQVRAAYLRVRQGQVDQTREVAPGRAFADYDATGLLLGIELLAPCTAEVLDRIAAGEPLPIRSFVSGAVPRQLVSA